MVIIGVFSFSSDIFAQKKTTNPAQASAEAKKTSEKKTTPKVEKKVKASDATVEKQINKNPLGKQSNGGGESPNETTVKNVELDLAVSRLNHLSAAFPFSDYGSTLNLTKGLVLSASKTAKDLRKLFIEKVNEDGNIYVDSSINYFPPQVTDLKALQTELERALENQKNNEFEEDGNRAKAIDLTEQALSRVKTFVENNVQKKTKAMVKNKAKKKP